MRSPPPVLIADRFRPLLEALLDLLRELQPHVWEQPTAVPNWSVKDIALHLLGGDIGILSRQRDGYAVPTPAVDGWYDLVAFVNGQNAAWVAATRRISPPLLCDLLQWAGDQVSDFFARRDPFALGNAVSWAGPDPAPVWLDVAREYTERWHHQQQIRDAVGRPGLTEPYFLAPVLDTFVRALPRTFRDVAAQQGTLVALTIAGEGGRRWLLERRERAWELHLADDDLADAELVLDADTAWRLFTRGLSKEDASPRAHSVGRHDLALALLDTVAVIA